MKSKSVDRPSPLVFVFFVILVLLVLAQSSSAVNAGVWGTVICAIGLCRKEARVDLWGLVFLLVYSIFAMVSSLVASGSIAGIYPSQLILPVAYMFACCLHKNEWLLLMRLATVGIGVFAGIGLLQCTWDAAVLGSVHRLGGVFHAPNGAGTLLMMGWFAVCGCMRNQASRWQWLSYLEPVVLTALGLTLSIGSILSLVAGVAIMLILERKEYTRKEMLQRILLLLARLSLGLGTGVLFYVLGSRTGVPQACLLALAELGILVFVWKRCVAGLREKPQWAGVIACLGICMAIAAIAVRPSATDTLAERFEMVQSGLRYAAENPLFGLGTYQWRLADLHDAGTYFGTWFIHNAYVHVAAENGIPAAVALILGLLRLWAKEPKGAFRGAYTAFLIHAVFDTSFFFTGITCFALAMAAEPTDAGPEGGERQRMHGAVLRIAFIACMVVFAYNIYHWYEIV